MSCTRTQIVEQAKSWLGCKESNGSHKKIIDVYNSHKPRARGYKLKYTDAWCSGFASACAIACDATDIIPTEIGCGKHITLFKKKGIWVENDAYVPLPGDYIFYNWKDSGKGDCKSGASHVGIVEKVEDGKITVIEGNYSNSVKRRTLEVNGRYIRGFGVPKYDADSTGTDESVDENLAVDGKWGKKTTTKLQQIFGTTVDGVVSNQIAKYKDKNPGLTSGWDWKTKPNGKGSKLIQAMQKWADMPTSELDGEIGDKTIAAIQTKFGTPVDGKVSNPSKMVKALQEWANKQNK